jgi:hypothetical protein
MIRSQSCVLIISVNAGEALDESEVPLSVKKTFASIYHPISTDNNHNAVNGSQDDVKDPSCPQDDDNKTNESQHHDGDDDISMASDDEIFHLSPDSTPMSIISGDRMVMEEDEKDSPKRHHDAVKEHNEPSTINNDTKKRRIVPTFVSSIARDMENQPSTTEVTTVPMISSNVTKEKKRITPILITSLGNNSKQDDVASTEDIRSSYFEQASHHSSSE